MKKILIISLLFLSIAGFSQTPKYLGSWVSADSMRVKKLRLFVETAKSYGNPKLYTYADSLYFWNGSEEFNLTAFVVYPETDPDFHSQVRDSSYLVLTDSIISVLESYGFNLSSDSAYIRKMQTDTSNITYAAIGNYYDTTETQTLIGDSLNIVRDSINTKLSISDTAALSASIQAQTLSSVRDSAFLQWADTTVNLATDYDVSLKADIADSSLWSQIGNDINPKTATNVDVDTITADYGIFDYNNAITSINSTIQLKNSTEATSGVPVQNSSSILFEHDLYDTDVNSDNYKWNIYSTGTSGAATRSILNFDCKKNDGSPFTTMYIRFDGIESVLYSQYNIMTGYFQSSKANLTTSQNPGLILNSVTSATDIITQRYSPSSSYEGDAWNGSASKSNQISIRLRPNNATGGAATSGDLLFENNIINSVSNTNLLMSLHSDGYLTIFPTSSATTPATPSLAIENTSEIYGNGNFAGRSLSNASKTGWFYQYYDANNYGLSGYNTVDNVLTKFFETKQDSVFLGKNNAVTILPNGNVGIGVIPGVKLSVLGTAGVDAFVQATTAIAGSGSTDGLIMGMSTDAIAYIWNYEAGDFRIGTNNAENIRITSDGKVGIGVNSPNLKTHIAGTTSSFPAPTGTTQTGGILRLQNGDSNAILDIGGNGGSGFWLQSTLKTGLDFNYSLLLNPNGGDVIIGTTTDIGNYKLQVNGNGLFTGNVFVEDNITVNDSSKLQGVTQINKKIDFYAKIDSSGTGTKDTCIIDFSLYNALDYKVKSDTIMIDVANITANRLQTMQIYLEYAKPVTVALLDSTDYYNADFTFSGDSASVDLISTSVRPSNNKVTFSIINLTDFE